MYTCPLLLGYYPTEQKNSRVVLMDTKHGNLHQLWFLQPVGNGLSLLKNAENNRVLDFVGDGDLRAALIVQQGDKGNAFQEVSVGPQSRPRGSAASGGVPNKLQQVLFEFCVSRLLVGVVG